MKSSSLKKSYSCVVASALAILLVCLAGPGYCEDDGTVLLLELSPVEGGSVNIAPGVHYYDRDSEVKLVAVPRPGYQFVYWVGNVNEATANATSVYLDSPKIVIAVFERSRFEPVDLEEGLSTSGGGGGLYRSPSAYSGPLGGAGGGKRQSFRKSRPEPPEEIPDDVPVPENTVDFPTPVPEPATIAFIFSGLFMLAGRRQKGRSAQDQTS